MFSFGKHIRELAIEFTSQNLIGQVHFLTSFSKTGIPWTPFCLTIYVTIKPPGISLHMFAKFHRFCLNTRSVQKVRGLPCLRY